MSDRNEHACSRRQLLKRGSLGFGYLALAGLVDQVKAEETFQGPLAMKQAHFTPRQSV